MRSKKSESEGSAGVSLSDDARTQNRVSSRLSFGHVIGWLLSGCGLAYPGEQVQHWFGFLETEDKACERGQAEIQHELMQDFILTLVQRVLLKTFQNLSVSSPAPVTMASPSGDAACTQPDTPSLLMCVFTLFTYTSKIWLLCLRRSFGLDSKSDPETTVPYRQNMAVYSISLNCSELYWTFLLVHLENVQCYSFW